MLIDTHCHIHEEDYPLPIQEVLAKARQAEVSAMICVGTNAASSRRAVQYAQEYAPLYAAIGVHPHDSTEGTQAIAELAAQQPAKLVAIGEIGLCVRRLMTFGQSLQTSRMCVECSIVLLILPRTLSGQWHADSTLA